MFVLDAVYVINMINQKTKRQKILKLFEEYKINNITNNIIIFDAIDGTKVNIDPQYIYSRGSYGCTLSHLGCIQDAINKKFNNVLIFEDDVIFNNNFISMYENLVFPSKWDILYLGATQLKWNIEPVQYEWYKAHGSLGGFAYILNSVVFKKVISKYQEVKRPVDEVLAILQKETLSFVYYPNLVIAFLDESLTRANNTWSLETLNKKLKWNLEDYDLKYYQTRNLRASNSLMLYNNIYKKCLKRNLVPFSVGSSNR